jgi:hypothetical protein
MNGLSLTDVITKYLFKPNVILSEVEGLSIGTGFD